MWYRIRVAAGWWILMLAIQACQPGGGGGPSPVTIAPPPTFVLAWNGPGGSITTAESSDGAVWARRTVHAATNQPLFGPALAHDGILTWLLMWANGPELQFKVGVGGTSPASGIVWETMPASGVLSVQPESSPAAAFANGRWLAVWHDAAGRLMGVRTNGADASSWGTPFSIFTGPPAVPAITDRAPALASATIGGQRVFVLVFAAPSGTAMVTTSSDGMSWSLPTSIDRTQKDPAITELNGNVYVVLSRTVGLRYDDFLYKSGDGVTWTQISSWAQAPINSAGPGVAVSPWKMIVTEQVGGALGGGAPLRIARRAGTPASPSANPSTYVFGDEVAVVTAGAPGPESAGHPAARTALLFAAPGRQIAAIGDVAATQSGIIDTASAPSELVGGKTALVRVNLRTRPDAAGQPGQVDSARIDVVDQATGATLGSVRGFAFAADNTTLLRPIPDSGDAHFFVPGSMIANDGVVRFDLTVASGTTRRFFAGVLEGVRVRRNPGIPLVLTGFDQAPPGLGTLRAELRQLGRMFPVADSIGALGGSAGVRFSYTTGNALPVRGSGAGYTNEFVLVNVTLNQGDGPGGVCAGDGTQIPRPGRSLTFNFTVAEDLNGDGVYSAAELANCMGGSAAPISARFSNLVDSLHAATRRAWSAIGGQDTPKFGAAVVMGGNSGQNRDGIWGQCPTGITNTRLCWATVGFNTAVIQHELGHALGGLCDVPCNGSPAGFPPGAAYDLLNRIRVPTPLRLMSGQAPSPIAQSFLTPAEYEQVRAAIMSMQYSTLASGGGS